jgi:hypothetical protein
MGILLVLTMVKMLAMLLDPKHTLGRRVPWSTGVSEVNWLCFHLISELTP